MNRNRRRGSGPIMGMAIAGLVVLAGAATWWSNQDVEGPPPSPAPVEVTRKGFADHQDAAFQEPETRLKFPSRPSVWRRVESLREASHRPRPT